MALWGNNDNVGSGGTVTLDYSNKVVSGWAGTAAAGGGLLCDHRGVSGRSWAPWSSG